MKNCFKDWSQSSAQSEPHYEKTCPWFETRIGSHLPADFFLDVAQLVLTLDSVNVPNFYYCLAQIYFEVSQD